MPENGYPHSRTHDDGAKPESFTRLRREVLEASLKLGVDELVLAASNAITAKTLASYGVVVLGSNGRVVLDDEVQALGEYYDNGGSVLVYADFQYGPDNWASDNAFLNRFDIEVLPDNFQPAVKIDTQISSSPILSGVTVIQGEGISQFVIRQRAHSQVKILLTCAPPDRPGCILPPADAARVQLGDAIACVFTAENPKGGRLAGVCDRNLFHNGPGPGSDIDQADNRVFARNLFAWLAHK